MLPSSLYLGCIHFLVKRCRGATFEQNTVKRGCRDWELTEKYPCAGHDSDLMHSYSTFPWCNIL